ncbi:unnamed protein product [Moneuplotes crassus]|uniref:Peptidase S54 rhomboid domain-containing protein n=1 Tax=Euplotes crassus TaxID=5936 RepID=A0AAD1XYK3_EUPCR|nr:unnamed protein product [Moneuplotes crassus]
MVFLLLLSPTLERHHGSKKYGIVICLLVLVQGLVFCLLTYIMTFLPAYGGSDYYYSYCVIGFSGINYAFILFWSYVGKSNHYFWKYCRLLIVAAIWIHCIMDNLEGGNISVLGHFGGALSAMIIRVLFFTSDERLFGSGRMNFWTYISR